MLKTQLMLLLSFFAALSGTSVNQSHFMSTLLCIETMVLTMFVSTSMLTKGDLHSSPTPIILLTVAACETGAGLALLATLSHKNANDLTKNLTLLRC